MKSLNDGKLITGKDIELATTASFKKALWEVQMSETEPAKIVKNVRNVS